MALAMRLLRHLKRGRVFYSYLLSYLFVLLIPILLSIALFNRAHAVVRAEADRANQLLLNQVKSHLDMVMADVQKLSSLVSHNNTLQGLLYKARPITNDEYYRYYLTVNDFRAYLLAYSSIVDFYVYLPRLDLIVSPKGYFTSRGYHSARMPRTGVSYEDWTAQFRPLSRRTYGRAVVETETNAVVNTVSVLSQLPVAQLAEMPAGWLVINIDARVFTDILSNTAWTAESLLLVYHEEFGVISSSGADVPLAALPASEDPAGPTLQRRQVRLGGRPYVLLRRDSDEVDWQYISLVPVDIYSGRFVALSRSTALAFALCVLAGGVLIYWFASARYRPVHALLAMLKPDAGGTVSMRSDEFAMITSSLRLKVAEGRRLRREVSRAKPVLAQRYLQQIFRGHIRDGAAARKELARLGVSLAHRSVALVLAEAEPAQGVDPLVGDRCLEALWNQGADNVIVALGDLDGAQGFLVSGDRMTAEGLFGELVRAKTRVEGEFPVRCAIGASSVRPRDVSLKTLYDEARSAIDFRLVKGRALPILYRDIASANSTYYYPMELETKLINSIRAGDSAEASAILGDTYKHNFGETLLSLEMAQCLMFDLISTMVKTLNSIVGREEDSSFWSAVRPIKRLIACRSLEALKTEMDDIVAKVCEYVRRGQTGRNEQLKRDILEQVHSNYRDPNLCADSIAERLKRNGAYLSHFFREHMSVGLGSYIKQYRVARAKALLAEGNLAIVQVASEVGFASSSALIRAFKETQGVTPGQFRASVSA